jgi:hypothetical protein
VLAPTGGQPKGSSCHTERGLFYPGTKYSVEFEYSGAARHSILVSVKAARLGDGSEWMARPSAYDFAEAIASVACTVSTV